MSEQTLNGVNITQLSETIEAIKSEPSIAKFNFRAKNRWINGGHNRSTIKEFFGANQEDESRKQPFEMDNGEPPVLLGNDEGPNPVEYVLNALAGCMTTTMVYHAAARGIKIEAIESTLSGNLDLHGFLQLKDDIRKGYENIKITFKIKSDASPAELEALAKNSPVFDIVSNPTPVQVLVEKQ